MGNHPVYEYYLLINATLTDALSIRPQSDMAIYFCFSHNNFALTAYIKVACILLFGLPMLIGWFLNEISVLISFELQYV